MLTRVLEPEVMDGAEEARDYDAMDHREVNRRFVEDLLEACPEPNDVLDVGTGTAQIPIELCRRVETCRVMAAEASLEMLELARYNLEVESLIDRIQLDQCDAKQMAYQDEMFDVVMSNSIVHHIAEPLVVLAESVRVACGGGLLFFRDLARPTDQDSLERLVHAYAGEENELQQKMFRESLRAALTLEEMRGIITRLGFDAETIHMTSDRHWTWSAVKPT